MMAKEYAEGVMDLAEYVDLREQLDPLSAHAPQVKTYHVRAATDPAEINERVVCATNGIALVADD
jgi:hypothetical protein